MSDGTAGEGGELITSSRCMGWPELCAALQLRQDCEVSYLQTSCTLEPAPVVCSCQLLYFSAWPWWQRM